MSFVILELYVDVSSLGFSSKIKPIWDLCDLIFVLSCAVGIGLGMGSSGLPALSAWVWGGGLAYWV